MQGHVEKWNAWKQLVKTRGIVYRPSDDVKRAGQFFYLRYSREGSTMVGVTVSSNFSGEVVLKTGCRDEDVEIQPDEAKTIKRQVDAETCGIALYVNNQEAYNDTIQDNESTTLMANSSGGVDDGTLER